MVKQISLYVHGEKKCIPSLCVTISAVSLDVSLVPTLAKLTGAVVGIQGRVASMVATVANMASQQSVLLEMMMRCIGGSTSVGR